MWPSASLVVRTTIDFLGHRITQHGATPLPDKVEAITQFQPSTVKGLQEFVGMVNFYHRFIPAAARIMQLSKQLRPPEGSTVLLTGSCLRSTSGYGTSDIS